MNQTISFLPQTDPKDSIWSPNYEGVFPLEVSLKANTKFTPCSLKFIYYSCYQFYGFAQITNSFMIAIFSPCVNYRCVKMVLFLLEKK